MPIANVNSVNIFYQVTGQGEPLVLLQGFGGGHQGWYFQVRAFKKHFQIITFDSRGIGKSDPSGEPYTIKTMAEDVVGLLDHLGIAKAHILGVSLGGIVAQHLALDYPERIKKLILVSTTTGELALNDIHPDLLRSFGFNEDGTTVDNQGLDFKKVMSTIITLSFNTDFYRNLILPFTLLHMGSGSVDGYLKQIASLKGYSTLDKLDLIDKPTLVLTGTDDKLVSPRSSEVISSRIPKAKLVRIEGGSHAFFIEMRRTFNKEVLSFLEQD